MALIKQSVRAVSFAIFLLMLASVLQAQVGQPEMARPNRDEDKSAFGSIRGRIVLPDGNYMNGRVKVILQTFRETVNTIFTDNQGQFEFPDLIPGNYQVEADPTDQNNFEVTVESVQVFKGAPSIVNITLKPHAHKNTDKAGTVSIAELDRKVPGSARKEFEKASKATQDGLADEAVAHLRKAIEIYPNFVMAYNDLGVQLLSQGKLAEAAAALERAVSLDRKAFNPTLNLGIALVHLHRFSEANETMSRALMMQPSSAAARLYSGLAFRGLGDLDNAEKNFKSAYETGGPHYAQALFYLGQIYLTQGNRNLSLEFLERYLAEVPNAANADQVRKMIASLR